MAQQMSEQHDSRNSPLREECSPSSGLPDSSRICAYYDQTWLDYRMLWLNPQNRAIHFGYWEKHTRSHAQSLLAMNRVLANSLGIRSGQRILDASFDVVWDMESLCHAPEKRLVLAEARRLLRPGGRLGMVEYMRTSRPYTETDAALLHSWLSGWAIPDLASAQEWLEWIQEVGFHNVQLLDITSNVRPSLRRLHRLVILTWPVAFPLHALGLRSEMQHGNVRGAFDQYRALRRGLWFYALLTATAVQG